MCTCAFFTCCCPTCEKTRFSDRFFLRRVLCSNLKRTCRLSFFRKKNPPCNTNLQWRIICLILGMRKTACEAAELCGVTKLIGQMSWWHLKQEAKHFYWRGVLKNALSRGVLQRNCWTNLKTFVAESLFCLQWDVALQAVILHEKRWHNIYHRSSRLW